MKSKSKVKTPPTLIYSTHNPLWKATLWKRQNWKLWRQKCCTWRNVHKSLLLPGNTVWFILWLDDVLFLLSGEIRWDFLRTQLQNLWPFHHLDLWSWFVCHFYCGGGGCRAASRQDHCWKTTVCIVVLVFMSLTSCPSFTSSRPCLWRCCMTAQWRQHLFLFLFKVGDKQEDDLDFSVPFTSDGGFTLRKIRRS